MFLLSNRYASTILFPQRRMLRGLQTLEKARGCLNTYTKLLNGRMFFYHEKCARLSFSLFLSCNPFRAGRRR